MNRIDMEIQGVSDETLSCVDGVLKFEFESLEGADLLGMSKAVSAKLPVFVDDLFGVGGFDYESPKVDAKVIRNEVPYEPFASLGDFVAIRWTYSFELMG